jgi:predicted DsbA family dithiol-disulfide isomerase
VNTIFTLRPWARTNSVALLHDYMCPWCWVGLFQAKKLTEETGVTFNWVGASLFPPELDGPASSPGPRPLPDPDAPKSRFDLFCDEEEIHLPLPRPGFVRTHNALLAAEWAKAEAPESFNALNEAIYRAFWERCENIEDVEVLAALAQTLGLDGKKLAQSVTENRYDDQIVRFDDGAYNTGIRNVPTFVFGASEQLAEANYPDLKRATERFLLRQKK